MLKAAGGLLVKYQGTSTYGLMDAPDVTILGAEAAVKSTDRILTLKTGVLSAGKGDTITVDGTSYVIRKSMAVDDGELTRYWLTDA